MRTISWTAAALLPAAVLPLLPAPVVAQVSCITTMSGYVVCRDQDPWATERRQLQLQQLLYQQQQQQLPYCERSDSDPRLAAIRALGCSSVRY